MCRVSWQPRERERENETERESEREREGGTEREHERTKGASERAKGFYCINSYTHQRRAIRMWSTPLFWMI